MRVFVVAVVSFLSILASADNFDKTYRLYDGVLKKYVKDGRVDYAGLQKDDTNLKRFISETEALSADEFKKWTREEQLAFWLNLYNAQTLALVLTKYPNLKSIREIKSGGLGSTPWNLPFIRLFKETLTLDDVEKKNVLKGFKDPRAHFALVCASISCPPLRSEAYTSTKLSQQLDDQGRVFLADKTKNSFDLVTKKASISKIFDWYSKDFLGVAGSVQRFLAPFTEPSVKAVLEMNGFEVSFGAYNWNLNTV